MTCPGASARGAEGCRHQALLYSSDEELLSVLAAFVGDGLEQNEPVLVVASAGSVALLADALGARRREVVFVDAADWLRSPSYALTSYRRFYEARMSEGARQIRVVGEPVWPLDSPDAVREWKRFESTANVAFAHYPAWIICAYDRRNLPEDVLSDAARTHPELWVGGEPRPSGRYVEPAVFARELGKAS